MPKQSASFTTKMQVWPVAGSSQAVAPDTAGTLERGLINSSQAWTSTHPVVCSRIVKLFPRQHVSASESDSLADSVPGGGCGAAPELELEFANQAEE